MRGLWDRHLEAMSDDYRRSQTCPHTIEQMVLHEIKNMLHSMGKDISLFPLPQIDESYDATNEEIREIIEESMIEVDHQHACLASSLNPEKRFAFDKILAAIDSDSLPRFGVSWRY